MSHERRFFCREKCNQNLSRRRESLRRTSYLTKIHASEISCGFSPASVNAADFPFDCNRTAIAPLPLQAKAVSNEQVCPISPVPLSRSITSAIKPDIYYMAVQVPVDVESFLARA